MSRAIDDIKKKSYLKGHAKALGDSLGQSVSKVVAELFAEECVKAYEEGQEYERRAAAASFYRYNVSVEIILSALNMEMDEFKKIFKGHNGIWKIEK
ncbi:MAG: hypothetical protein IJP63_08910 [Acholeplasmatales bacterium]|nr:hypothetical protein [Acholeplasmatales bacterium]